MKSRVKSHQRVNLTVELRKRLLPWYLTPARVIAQGVHRVRLLLRVGKAKAMKEHEEGRAGRRGRGVRARGEDVDVGGGGDRHAKFRSSHEAEKGFLRRIAALRAQTAGICARRVGEYDRERESQEAHVRRARYEHCGVELEGR